MRAGSLTRLSRYFLRTLREDPADAEVASHRLMVRAGCVRRVAPGVYSWLPFGRRVLDNVAAVVREEMDRMGAQEVSLPALVPRELYEGSGRWAEYGDLLFRLADRKGADYLLAPTHEELFALLVKGELSSYRDYPVSLYQIGPKYRDEARPRAGVLRGREFLMKDSYSFDLDDAGLAASYAAHRAAYLRVFDRLGLRYVVVSAVSGAMGGSASEEFLAPTGAGEDTYVSCPACGYAANAEALRTPPVVVPDGPPPPLSVVDTPDTPTIDTLVASLRARGYEVSAGDTLKNLAVLIRRPGAADEVAIVSVPGDREVDLKRLNAQLEPAEAAVADAAVLAAHPGLVRGYIGPQGLAGYRVLADPRVAAGTRWVTGANEPGRHAVDVVAGRDFTVDAYVEAVEVRAGDACPRCGGELAIERGIEVGHIFQLGRKYTDAFAVDALGPDGKPVRVTMGSYGIGISRTVAAIVEQSHDDAGIVWPPGVAPFDVAVLPVGKGEDVAAAAERVASELVGAGRHVLLDDRNSSAGEKFADADLLGLPVQVIAGKAVAEGQVELKVRATGERRRVALADSVSAVTDALAALHGNGAPAETR